MSELDRNALAGPHGYNIADADIGQRDFGFGACAFEPMRLTTFIQQGGEVRGNAGHFLRA